MPRDLTTLVQWVDSAETASATSRKNSDRDRDYYDGFQLTEHELSILRKRKQPAVITNIIQGKIDTLKGIEIQQRNKPLGLPRNEDVDEDAAEASTDGIRYVVENNKYHPKRSKVWSNMIVEGFGAVELSVKMVEGQEPEIIITQKAWDRLGYDPASAESDFSDAKYKYEIIWMDLDDAKAVWPDKKEELDLALSDDSDKETYEDKPDSTGWQDTDRKRVRIAKMYYHEAEVWYSAEFTKGSMLKEGKVPFVDDTGKNFCPLIMASGSIDRQRNRYGKARVMVSPQDMINKHRSKATHAMSVNRLRIDPDVELLQSKETIRNEYAKPDGIIIAKDGAIEDLSNAPVTQGNVIMIQEVKAELNDMGANRSLQGSETRDLSGKAERLRQNAGLLTLNEYLDNLRGLDLEVYTQAWWMIRQFWTEEKWVRVTDDENNVEFVGLNRTKTVEDQIIEEFGELPPELLDDPRIKQPFIVDGQEVKMNVPANIVLDIIIEQGPNSATIGEEQFEELAKLAPALPPELMAIPLLKASSIRDKDKIIDAIEGGDVDPAVAQQQQQEAEEARQIQLRGIIAEIEKTEAETGETVSKTELNFAKIGETETSSLVNVAKAQETALPR